MSYTKSKITRIGSHDFDYWKVDKRETNGVEGFEIHWSDDGECITDHVYQEKDAKLIASAPLLLETIKHIHSKGYLGLDEITLLAKAIEIAE